MERCFSASTNGASTTILRSRAPIARSLVARLDEEPHLNPATRALEFSLRDPDGYYVTISAY